jgi:ATP-dependent RNA helicase DDX10/DBP4
LQIFDVLRVVGSSHVFSAGLVIGGKDVQSEQELINTMNILVATPGRLLQHMDETHGFDCSGLLMLILDEADRMLDMGFEKTMNAIVDNLPKGRQTLLFSATLTKSVKALARLSLNRDAEVIGVHDTSKATMKGADTGDADGKFDMPRKLSHSYMVCELDKKLNVLYSFAKTHLNSKMIVFLSSCKQTKFFYEAIRRARPGLSVMCMHGRMKQMKRMAAYCRFCEASTKGSMLLATDIAARGLDFPSIDWVLQLDCPEDVATYIHRSGRTARYRSSGRSLLFLLPSEREAMLAKLSTEAKIVPRQVGMNAGKSFDLQESLAGWVAADPELKFLAQKAFVTFVRSYYLQKDKEVFDVGALPLEAYASALGLPGAPRIRLVKKSKSKSKVASTTAAGAAANDKESDTNSEEEDIGPVATSKRAARGDNVAKLMKRKNVGVLNPTRAALREDDSSGDESDDLMQIKRRDHELPERPEDGATEGADVDTEAAQKAELKKMSRKQRRIAKQLARGEVPRDSQAHKMRDGDTSIEGWQDAATTYAEEVRDRVAEQDTGDKGREKDRVRAKHRAERAARRAHQAEREGARAEEAAEGGYQVELGSPSDDDMASNEETSQSEDDSDGGSEDRAVTGEPRMTGKRKQQTHPVDSDSDIESESHSKRHQTASPSDLQAIAAQLLQSRSLI